jgi:hypothetical protein
MTRTSPYAGGSDTALVPARPLDISETFGISRASVIGCWRPATDGGAAR